MDSAGNLKLSICIPTYNFGRFIGETLDSIIQNLTDDVEVVIVDGGSTDDTAQVVANKQRLFPQIHYHFQNYRGGIDRDIAKAVSLSHGKYCWAFSADDIMKPGTISYLLDQIKTGYEVYLCEQTLCSETLEKIKDYPIFTRIRKPETFDLGNPDQRKQYFSEARTSEAFFSYLAGPIIKRETWERANGVPDSFNDTCWGIAGRLLSLIPDGLTVHYLGVSLINKRSGVDSFMDRGIVNRLRITVEGYPFIAETIFGKKSVETWHIRRVTRNEDAFLFRRLISVKIIVATTTTKENLKALNDVVKKHYSDAGFFNKCKYYLYLLSPVSVLVFLKSIKDKLQTS